MVTVTLIVIVDVVLRLSDYSTPPTPGIVAALWLLAGVVAASGALYGGSLVYEYGFNIETAGDHPVWHPSEDSLLPGHPAGTSADVP